MAVDQSVVASAYGTARGLGASDKVMLALFEAALVESGFRNLNYGDRDSVGFLQQRPSAGWGTVAECMNVPHATTMFVTRAKAKEARAATAGQLAQAVQVSAFPLRYDAVRGQAAELLNDAANRYGGQPVATDPVATGTQSFGGNPISAATDFAKFIADPDNWRRLGYFLAGLVLVVIAVTRMSGATQQIGTAVKMGTKVAVA